MARISIVITEKTSIPGGCKLEGHLEGGTDSYLIVVQTVPQTRSVIAQDGDPRQAMLFVDSAALNEIWTWPTGTGSPHMIEHADILEDDDVYRVFYYSESTRAVCFQGTGQLVVMNLMLASAS